MAKLFTVEEARALLPELRQILTELRQAVAELDEVGSEAAAVQWKARTNGHHLPEAPLARQSQAHATAERLVGRVAELGVELKDPRSGLVDFPSRRGQRTVYLCWRLDEPDLAFWHPIETGFAGRQPL